MIEVTGDLWTYPADCRVITTNGTVKKNGECVMGRGCASEAKQRYPGIAKRLGDAIVKYGNVVNVLDIGGPEQAMLFSYPVKYHWHQRADMELIRAMSEQLVNKVSVFSPDVVVMPRPGCGNGQLNWNDVRPVIAPILDDRFHVITWR